jgi:hypothetical protein
MEKAPAALGEKAPALGDKASKAGSEATGALAFGIDASAGPTEVVMAEASSCNARATRTASQNPAFFLKNTFPYMRVALPRL